MTSSIATVSTSSSSLSTSTLTVTSGQPVSSLLTSQQYQQHFLNIPSTLSGLTASGTLVTSSSVLSSTASVLSSGSQHLRLPQHQSPLPLFKTGGPAGHVSNIGTIAASSHSSLVPATCSLSSPLVIPTPALSRASSSGTYIPHTELSVTSSTVTASANINIVPSAKNTPTLTPVDPVVSSTSLGSLSTASGPSISTTGSSEGTGSVAANSNNSYNRMQEPEEQEKKPNVPPPGAFLPPTVTVPFVPYHSYYYSHAGAAHLAPHLHPSVAMSASSSVGGNPHQSTPPVPGLVPIKKEPHSPPPLKPSDKATDLSLTSSNTSHSLHRSHLENSAKHPHGFSQQGLPSTAPLPPPPLTVIDHRDGSKSDELSKSDQYAKDSPRGLPPSPHRPDSHSSAVLHRESRMDSNLSVLRESREIGLVGGLNPTQAGQQIPLSSIKEEPRSLPAAFQPYSHHLNSSSSSASSLPSHHASSSVLQVPQPHLSSDQPHGSSSVISSQSILSDSTRSSSRSAPNPDIENVKKESVTVEEIDVEYDDDNDDIRGGTTTPGPTPTVCNREIYKSNSAM